MAEDNELEFVLRFSLQSEPDQRIQCGRNWSVLQLKRHIAQTCALKPAVEQQRLIYAGHSLQDTQLLSEVFKRRVDELEDSTLKVVHLVCASKEAAPTNATPSQSSNASQERRQQPNGSVPPAAENLSLDQIYSAAYYAYAAQLRQPVQPQVMRRVSFVAHVQHVREHQPNPRPAQIRAVNDNALDLLDFLYKAVRALILMALIYYSPVERLVVVVLLICFMLYVQQRRERNQRNGVQANPEPDVPAPAENDGQANDGNNNELPERLLPNLVTAPVVEQGAWHVFWSTVASFFSSLIPENPVPLN